MPNTLPIAAPDPTSKDLVRNLAADLAPRVRGDVRIDDMTRALYATDASMYQVMPLAVVVPRTREDVHLAVESAVQHGIPVLARGGGSSLAGQTVNAALVIDFSKHLDAVLELNLDERWVRAEPGIVVDRLNAFIHARSNLTVGPDPASSNRATLGGIVANNATGTHSILYGNVVSHIRSIRGFLSDGSDFTFEPRTESEWAERAARTDFEGTIYRGVGALLAERGPVIARDTPVHWRRNNGYRAEQLVDTPDRNLARLLCGSEGTLAVTTEATLSLVERPAMSTLGIVHFRTRRESLEAVTAILETAPSAIELFDGIAIEQCRRAPGFARQMTFVQGNPGGVLITEYYGSSEAELQGRLEALEGLLPRLSGAYAVVRAVQPGEIANVWNVRKEGLGLIMGVKGDYKPVAFIEDASVPVEHLAEYIAGLTAAADETRTEMVMYAHASAGTLHVRPFINTKDRGEVRKMEEIARASMELVRRLGGSVSSEHGDGIARSWLTEPLVGKELYEVYRDIKRIFDPRNLLNPGRVVDAPPMVDHLRLGPDYATIPIVEEFDFSADGGFAGAVELCNGNGACRKLDSGSMCPSFMVTREEQDSTRGRANALRAAMSGLIPVEEFTGERMQEVMDLCVQCKACKTECPSNVDMAKLKSEWLSKLWETKRMPLRTRLFANLPYLAHALSGPAARFVNRFNASRPFRFLIEGTLGISGQRALPAFAPEPFVRWFRNQTWRTDGPEVVLFPDTFANYQHPDVARAASRFLDRAGYRVIVPEGFLCCGRTSISKGMLSRAQNLALRVVEKLHPYAEAGIPVVGLEPSCILTFRDEFLSLLPGDPRAEALAAVSETFEEFVAKRRSESLLRAIRWKEVPREILLHGHCHQKALIGNTPSEQCLSLPPGYSVRTVDSGCCGMAGAFGYEREHYDVSIAMAERRLAPAVRQTAPDTIIAAAGTSCRAQIADTTGRVARHPAEILLDALA